MNRRCPTCKELRGELAFARYIDGHVVKTRECIHCVAAAARQFHRERKARVGRPRKIAWR